MRVSGIYKIQSQIKSERIYIGSSYNVNRRWESHLCNLRKNKHHSPQMQNHFNKYGESDLILIIIEPCLPQFLIVREQYYIDLLNPFFNVCKIAGSCRGVKRSKEYKLKISKLHKGRKRTKQQIERHAKAIKGRKLNQEHIEKLKYYSKENHPCWGKKCSEETKTKISIANKGRKHSEETKAKMSIAQIGKVNSKETRERISKGRIGIEPWNKGKKLSEEHKQNMRHPHKKRA